MIRKLDIKGVDKGRIKNNEKNDEKRQKMKFGVLAFHQSKQLPIIERGWANYRDLSMASRSIICQIWNNWSARHWQITIFCNNRVQ